MAHLKCQLICLAFLLHLLNVQVACGPSKRIINGFNATAKQFPYQVFMDRYVNYFWYANCGGTIISSKWILTAAHCIVDNAEAFNIYLGAVDKSNASEPGQQQLLVKRSQVIVHPEYDAVRVLNDLALIRLPAELHFSAYIQPARLPDPKHLHGNENGLVSGWGVTDIQHPTSSNILQYYDVRILSLDDCTTLLHTLSPAMFVPQTFICLKPSGSTPCFGDSGGPLAKRNPDGSSTLLGVTSFRLDSTCQLNMPAIYTRVSSYLSWIKSHIDAPDC
ncbi:hypothetical protein KR093_004833 [Drosophila rubida]|uniref:Peptidase S1 domain-containing protein n=1 Tax=Drosophila rubida TaxID=30044 RepID=A0AAD4JW31_9MUSC|nr:hypothetical protein KR093_004833 [Drosophila rubida]